MRKWFKITGMVLLGISLLLYVPAIVNMILRAGKTTDRLLYLRTTANLTFGFPIQLVAVDPESGGEQFTVKDTSAVHTTDDHPPILSANRLHLYFVTKDSIVVVNSLTGEKLHTVALRDPLTISVGQGYYISAQEISPDERWYYQTYVTSPNDPHSMLIRLFSLKTGQALPELIKLPSYCWLTVRVKADLFARCGNIFKPLDLNTQQVGRDVPLPIPDVDTGAIALLPDGKLAYMMFNDNKVIIYDRLSNTVLQTISPSPALPKWSSASASLPDALSAGVDLQMSRDGSKLIMVSLIYNRAGLDHMQINLFDTQTWAALPAFQTRTGFSRLEFSANGSTMVAVLKKTDDQAYADTYVEIDTQTGQVRRQYTRPHQEIETIFFVP